jgi:hypothetical protein
LTGNVIHHFDKETSMKKLTMLGAAVVGAVVLAPYVVSSQTAVPAPAPQPAPKAVVYEHAAAYWVIYTVHSGTPRTAIAAARDLARVRDESGLQPLNDTGAFVYLDQPSANGVQLIEIQLPVEASGAVMRGRVQKAATATGLGTTDVRQLPERTNARIKKPVGVTDPTPYWKTLYTVVQDADQATTQGPTEVFSGVSQIPETCDYDELQTTLTVSVQ